VVGGRWGKQRTERKLKQNPVLLTMTLTTIISLLRNGLCCVKDLNLFSSTALYDPSYTALLFPLPPPHLSQTTPLEFLIGIFQFYAVVALIRDGIQGIKRGRKLKRSVKDAELALSLYLPPSKFGAAYRLVRQRLFEDAMLARKIVLEGFCVAVIGFSFIWMFANSFHVTPTNILGGYAGLIHALTAAEIALLILLYFMFVDACVKMKKSWRIKRDIIPKLEKSGGKLGSLVTEDFFDSCTYAWINNNGWDPYWTLNESHGESSVVKKDTKLHQEVQHIQLTIETLLDVAQDSQKSESKEKHHQLLPQVVAVACQRLSREAWILNMSSLIEFLSFVLNAVAFYGYLMAVLCFYFADADKEPEYWKSMKLNMRNADAEWLGNFAGDLMWTIEPFTLIIAPYLLFSMAPSEVILESKKVKSD
jgi:hypothetical protein